MAQNDPEHVAQTTVAQKLRAWGESSVPPTVIATLVAAQHMQPLRLLPLSFAPAFLFSSYLNVNGFVKDAAGFSAAMSALYVVLARRRGLRVHQQTFGVRGIVRGATIALCAVQIAGGGLAYVLGKREEERND